MCAIVLSLMLLYFTSIPLIINTKRKEVQNFSYIQKRVNSAGENYPESFSHDEWMNLYTLFISWLLLCVKEKQNFSIVWILDYCVCTLLHNDWMVWADYSSRLAFFSLSGWLNCSLYTFWRFLQEKLWWLFGQRKADKAAAGWLFRCYFIRLLLSPLGLAAVKNEDIFLLKGFDETRLSGFFSWDWDQPKWNGMNWTVAPFLCASCQKLERAIHFVEGCVGGKKSLCGWVDLMENMV